MSFRQYGGINYAARNNIVKNNYTNANNLSVMTKVGQPNSVINVDSGLNGLGGDITFQQNNGVPKYGIIFSDGSFQNKAVTSTDSYWVQYILQPVVPVVPTIYYTGRVLVGADPYTIGLIVGSNVRLAVSGDASINGDLNVGNITEGVATQKFSVDGVTGNTNVSGTLTVTGLTTLSSGLNVSSGLTVTGLTTLNSDALINGLTVGRGSGNMSSNTAIGNQSLFTNNTGANNTAVGYQSLFTNTGANNTAVGYQSLFTNTGANNTAVGYQSLLYNNIGNSNTALGFNALITNKGSNGNTALGYTALYNTDTNGDYNTSIGHTAGYTNKSGAKNTYIGYAADCSGNSFSFSTAIGATAKITASNQVVLGGLNSSVYPDVIVPGTLSVTGATTLSAGLTVTGICSATSFSSGSDYRIKENVELIDSSFTIDNLRPVTYTNKLLGKQDMGFIAHELQEHYPFLVTGEKDGPDNQSVNYIGLIALLVKEIQELKQDIKILKSKYLGRK
jgi:hypothetical protein